MKFFENKSLQDVKIKDFYLFFLLKSFFMIVFFCFFCSLKAQKQFILIDAQTKKEFLKKDSLAAVKFLDSLAENNYYFTKILNVHKKDNITKILFDKGKNYNEAQINVSDSLSKAVNVPISFFCKNLDSLKKEVNRKYIEKGFTFNRVKSKYIGIKNGIPNVQLVIIPNKQRKINAFSIKGYEKVPKRFIKNFEKEYTSKLYDDKNLLSIYKSLQNHPFVTLDRPPQTLFTKDSTTIYLFLQKKKVSSFDGIIGFGNDKSEKFTFNGTLNLQFRNIFNGFESIGIFWQRNPDKGQTFDIQTDIPYVFNSNLGANINVNIYRQDSTFANVKMIPSVYYHIKNFQKIGLRGTFETSTVLDSLFVQGKDYSKKGIGIWYDYIEPTEIELLIHKTKIHVEADLLSTYYSKDELTAQQTRFFFLGERNFHLTGNHWLNLKAETALLNSKNELSTNELLRFGGWNSIRGFNENSLNANFYYYGNLEYRYLAKNQAFFDLFVQYGQLKNDALNLSPKLYSFGVGFNFFLPIGLMSFQISNGSEVGNPIRFSFTKIHWGILTRF